MTNPKTPLDPTPHDAPVTVTFTHHHARELRRIARRVGGVGSDAAVAKLAEIAVVRGLVLVEKDLDATLYTRGGMNRDDDNDTIDEEQSP